MRAELKKIADRWGNDERVHKEMWDALLKGEFYDWGMETIQKMAGELREADPELNFADSLSMVMETEVGEGIYNLARNRRKAERQSKSAPLSKGEQVDTSMGPVAKELYQKADRIIEKSDGKLTQIQAFEKVLKADPELSERYRREVIVSTAVG